MHHESGSTPSESAEDKNFHFLQKYSLLGEPDYVINFLIQHKDKIPSFDDVPNPNAIINRISEIHRNIAEKKRRWNGSGSHFFGV